MKTNQAFNKSSCRLLIFLLTFFTLNVNAATVIFTVTGDVNNALLTFTPNDFGLGLGGTISATGTFDDSSLTNTGAEFASLSSLNLTVGLVSFDESDDTQGSGFPRISFEDGVFTGINFSADFQDLGIFDSAGDLGTFYGEDDNFGTIGGEWNANSYTVVPVPAAAWLFGSGLLGLAGIARRRKA